MPGCEIAGFCQSVRHVQTKAASRGGLTSYLAAINSMKRYSVRPATFADIDAVCSLITKQNLADYGEAITTTNELAKSWQSMDLEYTTCMAYADGELAGYAELRDGDSLFIYLADLYNMDLGFQLLTILEEKALRQKVEKLKFFTRISEKNQTLLKIFASYGYRTNLSFLIMELELDTTPDAPQWPGSICVRCFVPGEDEQGTYLADEETSQDKGYHQPLDFDAWAKRMRLNSEQFDPNLWFLAYDGRSAEITGVALNIYRQESKTGWVDHLGVRHAWRKKGIGRALLLHSLGEFYRRRIPRVKLTVDSRSLTNAPRLYESVGMKPVQQYYIYTKNVVRDHGLA